MANEKAKKKWYKKWWIWVIIGVFLMGFISGLVDAEPVENEGTDNQVTDNSQGTTDNDVVDDTSEEQPLTFELIAGEQGEYGELFTINKDTEFEETYYIYRIPAGTYKVTNTGEYMNQFNVYGETVYVTEEGWEELSDVFYVKLLKVEESDTFTIKDGQIIEIHEPGKFLLEKIA